MTSWEKHYERIIRINKELDIMLSKIPSLDNIEKDNMSILVDDFGLTYNQAKAWLEQEPNYIPIRRNFTEEKSDDKFTESKLVIFIWKGKTQKNEGLFGYN